MTTLREMCEIVGIDDNPMECAFVIAALLRTTLQKEPSTFDGECASIVAACETYGLMDKPESIRKWLDALGKVADFDVPDRVWLSIAEADRDV